MEYLQTYMIYVYKGNMKKVFRHANSLKEYSIVHAFFRGFLTSR